MKEKNYVLKQIYQIKKTTYNIGVTEPYFLDRHLSLFGNIYDQESENSKGDVKTNKTGFDFGLV